jgi:hypothetical protein
VTHLNGQVYDGMYNGDDWIFECYEYDSEYFERKRRERALSTTSDTPLTSTLTPSPSPSPSMVVLLGDSKRSSTTSSVEHFGSGNEAAAAAAPPPINAATTCIATTSSRGSTLMTSNRVAIPSNYDNDNANSNNTGNDQRQTDDDSQENSNHNNDHTSTADQLQSSLLPPPPPPVHMPFPATSSTRSLMPESNTTLSNENVEHKYSPAENATTTAFPSAAQLTYYEATGTVAEITSAATSHRAAIPTVNGVVPAHEASTSSFSNFRLPSSLQSAQQSVKSSAPAAVPAPTSAPPIASLVRETPTGKVGDKNGQLQPSTMSLGINRLSQNVRDLVSVLLIIDNRSCGLVSDSTSAPTRRTS